MTAPLHVSQVLEQECAAFNVPVSVDEASWLLRPDHITNPAALLAKLCEPTSYRRLGLCEVETIVGAGVAADLTDLVRRAQRHVQTVP